MYHHTLGLEKYMPMTCRFWKSSISPSLFSIIFPLRHLYKAHSNCLLAILETLFLSPLTVPDV